MFKYVLDFMRDGELDIEVRAYRKYLRFQLKSPFKLSEAKTRLLLKDAEFYQLEDLIALLRPNSWKIWFAFL
jgi:hypothetical protein